MALVNITIPACGGCCSGCGSIEPGDNTFEISKAQYDAYRRGGTWAIFVDYSFIESVDDPASCGFVINGGGSGIITGAGSGCNHWIEGTIPVSETFDYGDGNIIPGKPTRSAYLSVSLGKDGELYYVQFQAGTDMFDTYGSSNADMPPTISAEIDGNVLAIYPLWTPSCEGESGYLNNSATSLTATFTPNL